VTAEIERAVALDEIEDLRRVRQFQRREVLAYGRVVVGYLDSLSSKVPHKLALIVAKSQRGGPVPGSLGDGAGKVRRIVRIRHSRQEQCLLIEHCRSLLVRPATFGRTLIRHQV
jgi:hypothetical protein